MCVPTARPPVPRLWSDRCKFHIACSTPQLTDNMTTIHPSLTFVFSREGEDKTGAVHPCTRDCRLLLQHMKAVTDGSRVGQFRNPPKTPLGSQRNGQTADPRFFCIRNGSAKPLDWRYLQPFGGRRCERWVCSFQRLQPFVRSSQRCLLLHRSNSGLKSTRAPHKVRALRHGEDLRWPVQNARRRGCPRHSSARPLRSRWLGEVLHVASSFAWNWSYTPVPEVPRDVRGATARGDRTPSARLLGETPEIIHAHSGVDKKTCVPFARGDRWHLRHVLTDRCRCSARHRCVQRWR